MQTRSAVAPVTWRVIAICSASSSAERRSSASISAPSRRWPACADASVRSAGQDLGKSTDGGKTWTYTLQEGLKYEDGSPIKAQDVAYAVLR